MRIPFICLLVLVASHACGQVYAYCADSVKVQYDSLNDLVRDTGMVKDMLKPDQAKRYLDLMIPSTLGVNCCEAPAAHR